MADNPTVVLGIRQKNYCLPHALDAASKFYAAARPRSLSLLARVKEFQETRAEAPRRIQPSRGVKRKASPSPEEPCRVTPSVRRRLQRLLSEVPLPIEDGKIVSEERWKKEVEVEISGALAVKTSARWERGGGCGFGWRAWGCGECERERAEAPGVEDAMKGEGGTEGAGGQGDGERTAVAVMGGPVVVDGVGGEGWWDVEIPEEEIRRVGGLRFVVDVCGDGLVMCV